MTQIKLIYNNYSPRLSVASASSVFPPFSVVGENSPYKAPASTKVPGSIHIGTLMTQIKLIYNNYYPRLSVASASSAFPLSSVVGENSPYKYLASTKVPGSILIGTLNTIMA